MCGLFGAIGQISNAQLDAVDEALHHRGPDARGRFRDEHVALVHARLKVIDLSENAAQPMRHPAGLAVVFNGEIYNHRALQAELERGGAHFTSRSDTEAILHGYHAWGEAVIDRLDGMFAIAIWDARNRRLLLARDRAGKKPLFYSSAGGGFAFASTVGALRAGGTPTRLDESSIPFLLGCGYVPQPRTWYRDIYQLGPGERLSVELDGSDRPGTPRITRYFEPRFGIAAPPKSYEEARAKVRTLVDAAVERRLESDVPLGAFLSGGIDSTIVVGSMVRHLPRARTFSIGFAGDPRYDETHYARIAARAFGTDHTEFTLEPSSFDLVETLVRHHDGPFGDSSAIPTYVVSKLTRQHGTVALTGDGGDELFCGYQRFVAGEVAEHIPSPLRELAQQAMAHLPRSRRERSLWSRGQRFLETAAMPMPDRLARWTAIFPNPTALLHPGLRDRLGGEVDAPRRWHRGIFAEARGRTALQQILEHNFRTYLPEDLMVKADRCSMAHALEARAPLLDRELIEYAATLPPDYLRRGTNRKRILKDAYADILPDEIMHRGKMGFAVPLGTWFRAELREALYDRLSPGARIDDLLDRRAVDTLLREHAEGRADHGQRLWTLLTLEVWLRSGAVSA